MGKLKTNKINIMKKLLEILHEKISNFLFGGEVMGRRWETK